jgi:dihydropyrimidinase
LEVVADTTIDASGCLFFPAPSIRMYIWKCLLWEHFPAIIMKREQGLHYTAATTTVIDFILQTQGHSLYEAYNAWSGRAAGNAIGDYGFHMAVTDFNENTRKEIIDLVEKEGITSFKIFMAYKGALMIDDKQMVGLMNEVKERGGHGNRTCNQWRHDRFFDCKTQGRRKAGAHLSLFIAARSN